jgi:hypothetical protein
MKEMVRGAEKNEVVKDTRAMRRMSRHDTAQNQKSGRDVPLGEARSKAGKWEGKGLRVTGDISLMKNLDPGHRETNP